MEYMIVGDTDKYCDCLIYPCGKSYEYAQKVLGRIITCPDEHDKRAMKGHSNIRIEEVKDNNCWWNQGGLD